MKKLLFIFFFWSIYVNIEAQTDTSKVLKTDTSKPKLTSLIKKHVAKKPVIDTIKQSDTFQTDTIVADVPDLAKAVAADTAKITGISPFAKKPIDTFYFRLLNNPYLKTTGKPLYLMINEREGQNKDAIFYLLAGLLLFLAFIRLMFNRYFTNIFRLFFQPVFRQKQTREQLLQNSFPSFLMNLFFILSASCYITFLILHYQLTHMNFWWLFVYTMVALLVLYTSKFVLLTFAG